MEKKEIVKKSLDTQKKDEAFNKALARVISEKIDGKKGYEKYMDLIEEIRNISRTNDLSIEDAAKEFLER